MVTILQLLLFTRMSNYAKNEPVRAPKNWIWSMRDLLLCVDVVVKTLNLDISRCCLADYVK